MRAEQDWNTGRQTFEWGFLESSCVCKGLLNDASVGAGLQMVQVQKLIAIYLGLNLAF